MKQSHEKSPCCQGQIRRFGKRRRQCKQCKRTWRVHRRRRGRKRKREGVRLVLKYLNREISTLYRIAGKQQTSERVLRARLRRSLQHFLFNTDWPKIPGGQLIAIADGMNQVFRSQAYTFYFVLLKSSKASTAVIMPPRLSTGEETFEMWIRVFQSLPLGVCQRIVALVCDGKPGLVEAAKYFGWIFQLCHFHLWHRIANYLRTGSMARRPDFAKVVYALIDRVLCARQEEKVGQALKQLAILLPEIKSRGLRKNLSGFLKHSPRYRTYLEHPRLNLPTTSNSVESLIELVRNLQYRARGFSSLPALTAWICAVLKHKQTIKCNGHKSTELKS